MVQPLYTELFETSKSDIFKRECCDRIDENIVRWSKLDEEGMVLDGSVMLSFEDEQYQSTHFASPLSRMPRLIVELSSSSEYYDDDDSEETTTLDGDHHGRDDDDEHTFDDYEGSQQGEGKVSKREGSASRGDSIGRHGKSGSKHRRRRRRHDNYTDAEKRGVDEQHHRVSRKRVHRYRRRGSGTIAGRTGGQQPTLSRRFFSQRSGLRSRSRDQQSALLLDASSEQLSVDCVTNQRYDSTAHITADRHQQQPILGSSSSGGLFKLNSSSLGRMNPFGTATVKTTPTTSTDGEQFTGVRRRPPKQTERIDSSSNSLVHSDLRLPIVKRSPPPTHTTSSTSLPTATFTSANSSAVSNTTSTIPSSTTAERAEQLPA
eukprot:Lankesteria_metandrocarpae@DN6338_c0_g1_i1.p1